MPFSPSSAAANTCFASPSQPSPWAPCSTSSPSSKRASSTIAAPSPTSTRPSPCALSDRKSTRLNSSYLVISYAVFCLKKKKKKVMPSPALPQRDARNAAGNASGPTPRTDTDAYGQLPAGSVAAVQLQRIFLFFNDRAAPEIYPLSLHDALPI